VSKVQRLIANKPPNFSKCISYDVFSEVVRCPSITATTQTWWSMCTYVQTSNTAKVWKCSKCPPCARIQAHRRVRHCL